jgi:hypothetical protein
MVSRKTIGVSMKTIGVIVVIIIVVLVAYLYLTGYLTGLPNLFLLTPLAFPIIIIAGISTFLGYYFATQRSDTKKAKLFFNATVLVVFILILILEMIVFASFFTKGEIPYEECKKKESGINILSCALTGYRVSEEIGYLEWQWISFWIFFIILPMAFVFSLVWGFLSPTNLLPKPAMRVIAFVFSAYAVRQVFGVFLLDIAGYGVWGIGGIIIPLVLCLMLKRVFDAFLGPLAVAEKTMYGMIGAELYSWIEDVRKRLDKIGDALKNEGITANIGALEDLKTRLDAIKAQVDGGFNALKENENLPNRYKAQILAELTGLQTQINIYLSQIEKIKSKGKSGG